MQIAFTLAFLPAAVLVVGESEQVCKLKVTESVSRSVYDYFEIFRAWKLLTCTLRVRGSDSKEETVAHLEFYRKLLLLTLAVQNAIFCL